jgi:hypothetical protein
MSKAKTKSSVQSKSDAIAKASATKTNGANLSDAPSKQSLAPVKKTVNSKTSKVKATAKASAPTNRGPSAKGTPILGSVQSPLRIFQIYYEPWQRDLLDPKFAAIDK